MRCITACLLLTVTFSFSKNPPSRTPSEPQKPDPITLRTFIPPVASYLSLTLLNQKTGLNISAKKRLAEKVGTIGLTQTGLSKSTAEKIARCSIAALNNVRSSHSPSSGIKTAGKTFLSEIVLDGIENGFSIIPWPNTEDNVLFQSGKLIAKDIARHYLDKELADAANWYPKNYSFRDLEDSLHCYSHPDYDSGEFKKDVVKDVVKYKKIGITYFIQYGSSKIIAETLVKTTGKDTYLSIHQLPLITANDIANITVTGVTSHIFQKNKPQKTAKLMAEVFVVNKMIAAELGIFKKCWHHGVNNYRTITAIDKWVHNHSKIVESSQWLLEEFVLFPYNESLLEQLLKKVGP